MNTHDRIVAEPFSLQRRNPDGGTKPLTRWGFANETDVLTDVLLGSPAGPTRVISIAAYEAAFEQYDYSLASAVAMIMGLVQLAIVALVLGARSLVYRGPVTGGKG